MAIETIAYESVRDLFLNLALFGGSLGFAVAGLIMGVTRSMSKDNDMWAITFSTFAWLIALMIPSMPWALFIFMTGAIGLIFSFMPVIEKMDDPNIFVMAVISVALNLLLLFGSGAFQMSLGWAESISNVQADMATLLGSEAVNLDSITPDSGLCNINEQDCESDALAGAYDNSIFDVFSSVLAIGDYLAKAIKFIGMVIFAPYVIGKVIVAKITNGVIYYLMALVVTFWNLAILYKTIAFILNKRGMT